MLAQRAGVGRNCAWLFRTRSSLPWALDLRPSLASDGSEKPITITITTCLFEFLLHALFGIRQLNIYDITGKTRKFNLSLGLSQSVRIEMVLGLPKSLGARDGRNRAYTDLFMANFGSSSAVSIIFKAMFSSALDALTTTN